MTQKATNMPSALMMTLSDPSGDPRPKRMIQLLVNMNFLTDVLSYPVSDSVHVNNHFFLPRRSASIAAKIARRIKLHAIQVIRLFSPSDKIKDHLNAVCHSIDMHRRDITAKCYSLIVVEDLALLPLAMQIKGTAKIIFDAREYYPRELEHSLVFRLLEKPEKVRLCRNYLPRCDCVITVSAGLAAEYLREFGVSTTVVMSAPGYIDIEPRKTEATCIKMVHHGGATEDRRLENMIEIVKRLDSRFSLDLYLTGNPFYIKKLKAYATGVSRVHFCDVVPFEQILPMLCNYDIGLFFVQPSTFNLKHCLPNKFFEFIQARLMVAIGPSPDMALLVRRYNFGVVADNFSIQAMADALLKLTNNDIDEAKKNSHLAAKVLSFEVEQSKLQRIFGEFSGTGKSF